MGSNMEYPQKLKIQLPYDPAIPLPVIYLKKTKTLIQKDACTPMFITASFTIVKVWTTQVSIDRWIDKKDVVYYNGILLSHKKEWNPAIFSNVDGPRDYYA